MSLWGNIHEENKIDVQNDGAELDEEFSNVLFFEKDSGKNSIRYISGSLSDEIFNLSITDEVGNLTRAVAEKKEENIDLHIVPRFALYGKWKSFWDIQFD